MIKKCKYFFHKKPVIVALCTIFTFALHGIHDEWMTQLINSGSFVSLVMIAFDKDK